MNNTLQDIKSSALQLNKKERVELLKSLLESIEDEEHDLFEDELINVVQERKKNLETGNSGTTSWKEFKKEMAQKKHSG